MATIYKIQTFLNTQLEKLKYNRKLLAHKSGIPYTTVLALSNGIHSNPSINNILKIANFFNCQIDEILGRDQYIYNTDNKSTTYNDLNHDTIITNLQEFLKTQAGDNMQLMNLSIELGFGYNTLYSFVYMNQKRRMLSSQVLVSLADYFNISIDRMIGRL